MHVCTGVLLDCSIINELILLFLYMLQSMTQGSVKFIVINKL